MANLTLQSLGQLVSQKRGHTQLRAAAKEIGISPATLSRVERGHLPDVRNLTLICKWLEIDAGVLLGSKPPATAKPTVAVHFRKDAAVKLETAQALAEMILAAQRALAEQVKS